MTTKHTWGAARFIITRADKTCKDITVSGRDRWALECLKAAGPKGCTPIETPGPRWSGYVFKLRALGVEIETRHEAHDGPFKGTHARYVLGCQVQRADEGETA